MPENSLSRISIINDFATKSFRDFADQDYISARVAYRNEFDQQFRWCSLQAVEKYLKAILLYNDTSAKSLGHDLVKALKRVESIPDLEFSLPADAREFVEYLNNYGADRYLSYPTHVPYNALIALDKTVWYIRRYCFYMRGEIETHDGKKIPLLPSRIQEVKNAAYEQYPHRYRILGGYLEQIIDKRLPAYGFLVWKNFYFGKLKKHAIKNFRNRISSTNPAHSLYPEIFAELDKLVDFPRYVRDHDHDIAN